MTTKSNQRKLKKQVRKFRIDCGTVGESFTNLTPVNFLIIARRSLAAGYPVIITKIEEGNKNGKA
jgi:hypothetical protein